MSIRQIQAEANFAGKVARALASAPRRVAWGLHPSSLYDFCPIHAYWMGLCLERKHDPEDSIREFAQSSIQAELAATKFSGSTLLRMNAGTASHHKLQYYGGLSGNQVGVWVCPECGYTTDENGEGNLQHMPVVTDSSHGVLIKKAGRCPKCGKNHQHTWPWLYQEPRVVIPELGVYGNTDGIWKIYLPERPAYGVIDYKTSASLSFDKNIPYTNHWSQLELYALGLRKQLPSLDFIAMVYENKDTNGFKEFYREPKLNVAKRVVSRIQTYRKAAKVARPPSSEHRVCSSANTSRAKSCPFRDACFGKGA